MMRTMQTNQQADGQHFSLKFGFIVVDESFAYTAFSLLFEQSHRKYFVWYILTANS